MYATIKMLGLTMNTFLVVFLVYITGVASYVLSTVVCDTILYYFDNKKSWKGYTLSEVNIVWELCWASWLGAYMVIEDCVGNIKLRRPKK